MSPFSFQIQSPITKENPSAPVIPPKELAQVVQDLRTMSPWPGLRKITTLVLIISAFLYVIFGTESLWVFVVSSVGFAFFYASLLFTTHDACHKTLTGWKWFDEVFPRVISVLPFWPHATYQELHKLHHKMNGAALEDPERTHWSYEEYLNSGFVGRVYARHQVFARTFLLGGFGLITELFKEGIRISKRSPAVRKALLWDLATLGIGFGSLVGISIHFGVFWKFAAFYLCLERITGGIIQTRNTLEHYGLWGRHSNYFETQLYNCRNIKTHSLVSWYFNGLNFHSVHHAFPDLPFFNLKEGHKRLSTLLAQKGKPLIETKGYLTTFWTLLKSPCLVHTPPLAASEPLPSVFSNTVFSALRSPQSARAWIQAVQKKLGSFPFAG